MDAFEGNEDGPEFQNYLKSMLPVIENLGDENLTKLIQSIESYEKQANKKIDTNLTSIIKTTPALREYHDKVYKLASLDDLIDEDEEIKLALAEEDSKYLRVKEFLTNKKKIVNRIIDAEFIGRNEMQILKDLILMKKMESNRKRKGF
jgi:16S rRNA C967 or C1407 C5-methylase (RsmB/RsmF family)